MSFDVSTLKPDEKQLLFKNLVTSEFTMMRTKPPPPDDPFWKNRGPPQIMPRKSPFRTSSNANFLLHNKDNDISLVSPSKKVDLFQQNHVVVVNNAGNFQKELQKERAEHKQKVLQQMNNIQNQNETIKKEVVELKSPKPAKQFISEQSVEAGVDSNKASSTMNQETEQAFGLIEDDPELREQPPDKQFKKYEKEINYEEDFEHQKKRAETAEGLNRRMGRKSNLQNKKNEDLQSTKFCASQINDKQSGSYKVTVDAKDHKKIILQKYREEAQSLPKNKVPKNKEWYEDEHGVKHKYVVIDGRYIKPTLYPPGFDFSLIKGMNIKRNEPLKNYNNMVMEMHIVDESKIVSQRPQFDKSQMYSDLDEPLDFRFLSQQYRINNYSMMNNSVMHSPKKNVYITTKNLSREVKIETQQFKNMKNRNDFKLRKTSEMLPTEESVYYYQQTNKYFKGVRPKTQEDCQHSNRVFVPNYGAKVPQQTIKELQTLQQIMMTSRFKSTVMGPHKIYDLVGQSQPQSQSITPSDIRRLPSIQINQNTSRVDEAKKSINNQLKFLGVNQKQSSKEEIFKQNSYSTMVPQNKQKQFDLNKDFQSLVLGKNDTFEIHKHVVGSFFGNPKFQKYAIKEVFKKKQIISTEQDSIISTSPRFGDVSDLKTYRQHYQKEMEENLFIPVSVTYGGSKPFTPTSVQPSSSMQTHEDQDHLKIKGSTLRQSQNLVRQSQDSKQPGPASESEEIEIPLNAVGSKIMVELRKSKDRSLSPRAERFNIEKYRNLNKQSPATLRVKIPLNCNNDLIVTGARAHSQQKTIRAQKPVNHDQKLLEIISSRKTRPIIHERSKSRTIHTVKRLIVDKASSSLEKIDEGFKTKIQVIGETPSKNISVVIDDVRQMNKKTEPQSALLNAETTQDVASINVDNISQKTLNYEDESGTRRSVLKKQHGQDINQNIKPCRESTHNKSQCSSPSPFESTEAIKKDYQITPLMIAEDLRKSRKMKEYMAKYKGCFTQRSNNKTEQQSHLGAAKAYAISILNQKRLKPQVEEIPMEFQELGKSPRPVVWTKNTLSLIKGNCAPVTREKAQKKIMFRSKLRDKDGNVIEPPSPPPLEDNNGSLTVDLLSNTQTKSFGKIQGAKLN